MVTTISHRELRNGSGKVLQAVASGESYTVTNHGKPIALLVPVTDSAAELPLHRSASVQGGFSTLRRHRLDEESGSMLGDLRGER